MKQVILVNGKACTGMFDYAPGNGMMYEGEHNISELKNINFTKNSIDNPAVENLLREKYGLGKNLPEVQSKYNPKTKEFEKDLRTYIDAGDIVYSVVTPDGEKIHRGKLSGDTLPIDLKIKVLKYIGI